MPTAAKPEELEHKLPFDPPSVELVRTVIEPYRRYFAPQFFGMENVDKDKPSLYVNNHAVMGLFDGSLFGAEIYEKKGIFLRSLMDNIHFELPVWRSLVKTLGGGVLGTRSNCAELMKQKEHILVYPGGGREVCKKKGEAYVLTWKNRLGFARMAIEYGYPIIPVATLGTEDTYRILADSDDIMNSKLGQFLKEKGFAQKFFKDGDHIPPIVRGIGFTPFPKPVKFYIKAGAPIDTTRFNGLYEDEQVLWQLRQEVELAMYKLLEELMAIRDADTDVPMWRKLLSKL
ncbi:MAG: lysophospholipid acyltransferase family protein [Chitinophagales bacterium]|nr:lysophospholipid acyltransferase family protein [Chitinophagales bacterium]